jgi:upstream activation factor subunit UAF30
MPEQHAQYTVIIDNILSQSDLATISEKKIRRALAETLGYDISDQKVRIASRYSHPYEERLSD